MRYTEKKTPMKTEKNEDAPSKASTPVLDHEPDEKW